MTWIFLTLSATLFQAGQFLPQSDNPHFFTSADLFFREYVRQGKVDYQAIKKGPDRLNMLLDTLALFDLARLDNEKQVQAFWINAYNLLVIHSVVKAYPIKSPLEVEGFFNQQKHRVAGRELTLDEIEKEELLKRYRDPRFHFVLVCAAKGCPELVNHAYIGEKLETQLQQRSKATLNDARYVRVDDSSKKVYLVEIFKWYEMDFTSSSKSVVEFINGLREQKIPVDCSVDYIPYDWSLNEL